MKMKYSLFAKNRKGQMGGAAMAIIFAFVALAVIGVIQLIGVLITSKVSATTRDSLDTDTLNKNNESVTITSLGNGDNSTLLAQAGFLTNSETVMNDSNGRVLVRNTEYKITLVSGDGIDDTTTRANFTLLNVSQNVSSDGFGLGGYNTSALDISYKYASETAFHTTYDSLKSNNLDAFELGGTGQIVYAASVVILAVFGIIVMFRRG